MIGLARPTHSGNLCVEYQIMRRLCSSSREGKNQNLSSENALWEKTTNETTSLTDPAGLFLLLTDSSLPGPTLFPKESNLRLLSQASIRKQ